MDYSERLHLAERAGRLLFTTDAAVDEWLQTPAVALRGKQPMELLGTDEGLEEVVGLIRGLAEGNFQ